MAILSAADQATYFPTVMASGAALEGLIRVAQAICEGPYGAGRPLDLTRHTEIISTSVGFGYLSRFPAVPDPTPTVELRRSLDDWNRSTLRGWMALTTEQWSIDYETGQLNLAIAASEARISYTSGFEFGLTATSEAQYIKAIAGLVLAHMATNKPGLDGYSFNPTVGDAVSFNYAKLDDYLEAVLLPLKRYTPRALG